MNEIAAIEMKGPQRACGVALVSSTHRCRRATRHRAKRPDALHPVAQEIKYLKSVCDAAAGATGLTKDRVILAISPAELLNTHGGKEQEQGLRVQEQQVSLFYQAAESSSSYHSGVKETFHPCVITIISYCRRRRQRCSYFRPLAPPCCSL